MLAPRSKANCRVRMACAARHPEDARGGRRGVAGGRREVRGGRPRRRPVGGLPHLLRGVPHEKQGTPPPALPPRPPPRARLPASRRWLAATGGTPAPTTAPRGQGDADRQCPPPQEPVLRQGLARDESRAADAEPGEQREPDVAVDDGVRPGEVEHPERRHQGAGGHDRPQPHAGDGHADQQPDALVQDVEESEDPRRPRPGRARARPRRPGRARPSRSTPARCRSRSRRRRRRARSSRRRQGGA